MCGSHPCPTSWLAFLSAVVVFWGGFAPAPLAAQEAKPAKAPESWAVATADTIMKRYPDFRKAYFKPWTYVHGYDLYGFEMLFQRLRRVGRAEGLHALHQL